jgi:hypothetical protein
VFHWPQGDGVGEFLRVRKTFFFFLTKLDHFHKDC